MGVLEVNKNCWQASQGLRASRVANGTTKRLCGEVLPHSSCSSGKTPIKMGIHLISTGGTKTLEDKGSKPTPNLHTNRHLFIVEGHGLCVALELMEENCAL